jgi:RNA polymerase primary sigma factor
MTVQTENKDSNLTAYLCQIRNDRLLTADEEKDLSKRILKGDEIARENLINSNLRLVVKIARGYLTHDMDLLDLIQRLPHRKEEKLRKISKASQKFSKLNGRTPDAEELSSETKIDELEIRNILRLPEKVLSIESATEGDGYSLPGILQDSKYDPDFIVMRKYLREKTSEMLQILTEKERKVLLYRYSFINGKKYTLKYIGEILKISPETVRQIEMKALKKIREYFSHLKELLWD